MSLFSRATIMDVMYLLRDMKSHSQLSTYTFRYGLDKVAIGDNLEQRVLGIGKFLLNNPETPGVLSDNLAYEIVEDVINHTVSNHFHFDTRNNEFVNYPQLRRLLLKDGFVIENGSMIRTFDTDIDFETNENLLEKLLTRHNLDVAKGHYNQANNAFNRGDWAACNGQLRAYVEDLFTKLANKITGQTFNDSHSARVALSQCNPPIFHKNLNEWLDNGQGFFETFWKRLHKEGPHPGLSNEADSIFRLSLVQISTLEVLRRYNENHS